MSRNTEPVPNVCTNSSDESSGRSVGGVATYCFDFVIKSTNACV